MSESDRKTATPHFRGDGQLSSAGGMAKALRRFKLPGTLPWLLVTSLTLAAAAVATPSIFRLAGLQKATWLRLDANGATPVPLPMRVIYNGNASKELPVIWNMTEGRTAIGLELKSPEQPVRLLGVETESGPISLDQVRIISKWDRPSDSTTLRVTGPGLLVLSGEHGHVTLIFEAGADAGTVLVHWYDQQIPVNLSTQQPGAYPVHLDLRKGVYCGWVLLPPEAIDRLGLEIPAAESGFVVRQVTLFGRDQQTWDGRSLASGQIAGKGCGSTLGADGLVIRSGMTGSCVLTLPGLRIINRVSFGLRILTWSALALAGLATLGALSFLSRKAHTWEMRYDVVESRFGKWLREHAQSWTVGKVALVVGAVAMTYHFAYAIFTPMMFSPDSTGYYAWAREFFSTLNLDSINTYRTPGYPIIYALTIWLFGDQVLALILLQHVALALLGPLTVWFLYQRLGPVFAGIGGLMVGLSPMVSIAASVVWTESLFAVSGYAALLFFLRVKNRGAWPMLLVGAVAGTATLIRPNGVLLIVLMLGWLFLEWWVQPDRARTFPGWVQRSACLSIGCVVVLSPWLYHIKSRTGEWEFTSVSDRKTDGGQSHTNTPEHATYINTIWQSRSLEVWEITRPYHGILRSLPENQKKRLENVTYRQDLAYGLFHWSLVYDKRFPTELFREYIRRYPAEYLQLFREALVFNVLHVLPVDSPFFVYQELGYPDYHLARPYPIPVPAAVDTQALWASRPVVPEKVGPLLEQMIYRWEPPRSPIRSALLWSSRLVVKLGWTPIAALALGGLAASILLVVFRDFGLLGLFWLGNATAAAAGLAGANRYSVVCEPLLYDLMMVLVYAAIVIRLKRRKSGI